MIVGAYDLFTLFDTDAGDFQARCQCHSFVHGECGIQVVVLQDVAAHFPVLFAAQLCVVHVDGAGDAVATVRG